MSLLSSVIRRRTTKIVDFQIIAGEWSFNTDIRIDHPVSKILTSGYIDYSPLTAPAGGDEAKVPYSATDPYEANKLTCVVTTDVVGSNQDILGFVLGADSWTTGTPTVFMQPKLIQGNYKFNLQRFNGQIFQSARTGTVSGILNMTFYQ